MKNNTDLKGAIITSNPFAEILNKNSLSTGTLTYTYLHNQTEYDTNGIAVGGCVNIKATRIVLEKIKEGRSTNNINLKSILKRFYLYYFN